MKNQNIRLRSSRILNESMNLFGLTVQDIFFMAAVYFPVQYVLIPFGLELLSLLFVLLLILILIPIRTNFRSGILRDYASSLYVKTFRDGFINVP